MWVAATHVGSRRVTDRGWQQRAASSIHPTTPWERTEMATLKLTSLHCDRRQDLFGQDEIVIVVNKQTAWFDSMLRGET
jgi:hypothetical protein